jgi:hypothetical protein
MQRLLREVNETVVEVNRTLGASDGIDVLCECGDACGSFLTLAPDEYARIRSEPGQFCVLPGHEHRDADVVERHDRWLLVAVGEPEPVD